MRIRVRLPQVQPNRYDRPKRCPREGCDGRHFKAHGVKGEHKALRDPQFDAVVAYRRRCLSCGGTFRVYPRGVSGDQQSDRLKAVSVLLYVLGLSYGAVEDLLSALGMAIAKTTRNALHSASTRTYKWRAWSHGSSNGKCCYRGKHEQ
jgi:hypothetical protein